VGALGQCPHTPVTVHLVRPRRPAASAQHRQRRPPNRPHGSRRYVEAALDLVVRMPNSFSRELFVSADDQLAIDEAQKVAEARKWVYVSTRLRRMSGGHRFSGWGAFGLVQETFMGHLLQLLMSLEADAWVGTRSSNWNRLIDELRCVWVDKCPNAYVEVGGPVRGTYEW
jgi:hypothetical protein